MPAGINCLDRNEPLDRNDGLRAFLYPVPYTNGEGSLCKREMKPVPKPVPYNNGERSQCLSPCLQWDMKQVPKPVLEACA